MAVVARRFRQIIQSTILMVAAAVPLADVAQAEWPERNITIVSCFPAGGGTDIMVRFFNNQLGEKLGKPVIVENRAGASGLTATQAVQRTQPDGYTLLACSSAFVVNTSLYANANYDPLKDFDPVIIVGASPNVFVVPANSEFKSMQDFIDKAKANPGKYNYTTPGPGTTPYFGIEHMKLQTGIKIVHVPFTGAGPATQAAIAGQVELYSANLGSVGAQIEGGQFRPIIMTSKERLSQFPNVPTLHEMGIPDAVSDTFQGIYAPAGTPRPVIDRLYKEIAAIISTPEMKEKYAKSGLPVLALDPDASRKRIEEDVKLYRGIMERSGMKKIGAN